MADFKFEIVEHLGVLSESAKGWTKELNKVSFNDRPAKYDLREWDPDHIKMSKGVTLNDEEIEILSKILKDRGI
ncbi:YdbC family protein [Peptoniphilus sp. MSJ-1]|uniref:YdbC family protein n=1 Tax=Peptoniphilus ovalis TaxID=2841503 RepID=A0ABS6FET4_9FIRM|nr:YdbC family protein [Peptoniphilus ovalis]MBU5668568.1 YdbC family protein [Peptoniphilus ovalis]